MNWWGDWDKMLKKSRGNSGCRLFLQQKIKNAPALDIYYVRWWGKNNAPSRTGIYCWRGDENEFIGIDRSGHRPCQRHRLSLDGWRNGTLSRNTRPAGRYHRNHRGKRGALRGIRKNECRLRSAFGLRVESKLLRFWKILICILIFSENRCIIPSEEAVNTVNCFGNCTLLLNRLVASF